MKRLSARATIRLGGALLAAGCAGAAAGWAGGGPAASAMAVAGTGLGGLLAVGSGLRAVRANRRMVALLRTAVSGSGDLTRRLELPFVDCSAAKGCGKQECASFGKREACWSHVGSLQPIPERVQCPGVLSGKVKDCSECAVFRAAERDEFDSLANWLNIFMDKTRYTVLHVQGAAGEMATAAEQLSATTAEIASSNDQVTVQAEAVATGAEQMSSTVGEVAGSLAAVNEASDDALRAAGEGVRVVSETVAAVHQITALVQSTAASVGSLSGEAEKIGAVVQIIEDIADQTNLLALNAAIEAARAGDHGRGFAVVADEVRKLAEKTVRATQDISATVASIQEQTRQTAEAMEAGHELVERGGVLAEQSGTSIGEIQSGVEHTAERSQQIAAATEEMAATIRQVAENMDEIARGVGHNRNAAVEIADTTQTVSQKAELLRDLAGRFTI